MSFSRSMRVFGRRGVGSEQRRSQWWRPCLESLEPRLAPSTATVTNSADEFDAMPPQDYVGKDGLESMAEAVQQLNDQGGGTLQFAVGSLSPSLWGISVPVTVAPGTTIDLGGGSLSLTAGAYLQDVTISDGLLQIFGTATVNNATFSNLRVTLYTPNATFSGMTLDNGQLYLPSDGITVDQLRATNGSYVGITGSDVTVQNSEFIDSGMEFEQGSANNVIQGNYIHGDAHSNLALTYSNGNTVSGNTIWNNGSDAISMLAATNNLIQGNNLGTDQSGLAAGGTTGLGIFGDNDCDDNRIVGNVISGNSLGGIELSGDDNVIVGNHIGVDFGGQLPLPNGTSGRSSDTGGISLLGGTGNIIGGTGADDGNIIANNYGGGINLVDDGGDVVQGNWIGLTGIGAGAGNIGAGVTISSQSDPDTIENNVISGNSGDGLDVFGNSGGCTILGNFIGTTADGTQSLGNGGDGILITCGNNTIGDGLASDVNVISGNGGSGIHILGSTASGNVVEDNHIGTTADGSAALPNGSAPPPNTYVAGVFIDNAPSNTIGGTGYILGNLIAGNAAYNVFISGSNAYGNMVLSNFIGAAAPGNQPLSGAPGPADGVGILEAFGNTIEDNIISGNTRWGITINGDMAGPNTVSGNYIGTDPAGDPGAGNQAGGVYVDAPDNYIGSPDPSQGNVIANNGGPGVAVLDDPQNTIFSNSIFNNAGTPEIQLFNGANSLIQSPTLQSATLSGGVLTVVATLDPAEGFDPGTSYVIQFFASSDYDMGGGPGQILLASTTTSSNTLMATAVVPPPAGLNSFLVSATVTDPQGNTSQFSIEDVFVGGGGGGGGAAGQSGGKGLKAFATFGGGAGQAISASPYPHYDFGLQPNRVYLWPPARALGRAALRDGTASSRPLVPARHTQDAVFERWDDGVVVALARDLWS
jgi:parallel beta-helix repeat protein